MLLLLLMMRLPLPFIKIANRRQLVLATSYPSPAVALLLLFSLIRSTLLVVVVASYYSL